MITLNRRFILSRSSEDIIFNGIIPAGATSYVGGTAAEWNRGYTYDGTFAHIRYYSNNTTNQHFFVGSSYPVNKGPIDSSHYIHQYLFINNIVSTSQYNELMIQINAGDPSHWEHRAYWGDNYIEWGTNNTESRRYMGAYPTSGKWVCLSIPLHYVGMVGLNIRGLAFTCYNMGDLYWGPTYLNSISRLPETKNKKYFIFSNFDATLSPPAETTRLLAFDGSEQVAFSEIDIINPSALGINHDSRSFLAGDGTWKSVGELSGHVGTILNKYNYGGL